MSDRIAIFNARPDRAGRHARGGLRAPGHGVRRRASWAPRTCSPGHRPRRSLGHDGHLHRAAREDPPRDTEGVRPTRRSDGSSRRPAGSGASSTSAPTPATTWRSTPAASWWSSSRTWPRPRRRSSPSRGARCASSGNGSTPCRSPRRRAGGRHWRRSTAMRRPILTRRPRSPVASRVEWRHGDPAPARPRARHHGGSDCGGERAGRRRLRAPAAAASFSRSPGRSSRSRRRST